MPRIAGGRFKAEPIFMIVMLAVVGLYLFSTFFTYVEDKKEGFEFIKDPKAVINETTLMVFKILIIGVVTYASMILAGKLGSPMGKKDAFTLILLGIGIWFLWDKFLAPLLEASTLTDFANKFARAIIKP